MSLAALALVGVGLICVKGFFALRGKPSPAGSVVPLLDPIPDDGEFGRFCRELLALGFEPIGDYKRETPLLSGNSVAVLRAFRSDERRAEAIVYRLTSKGAAFQVVEPATAVIPRRWAPAPSDSSPAAPAAPSRALRSPAPPASGRWSPPARRSGCC
jgi:hypothetical protein